MSTEIEDVIAQLKALYPDKSFTTVPSKCLADYSDKPIAADLPEHFVALEDNDVLIFDLCTDVYSETCAPAFYDMDRAADAIMFAHNKIRLSDYI